MGSSAGSNWWTGSQYMPPSSLVAGVSLGAYLERGPHIAPANEGFAWCRSTCLADQTMNCKRRFVPMQPLVSINNRVSMSYEPSGTWYQVWGARTLSSENYMRYISVRRCLSAIQRRLKFALDALVFEPNSTILWMQITQIASAHSRCFLSPARCAANVWSRHSLCAATTASMNRTIFSPAGCTAKWELPSSRQPSFIVFRLGRRERRGGSDRLIMPLINPIPVSISLSCS